MAVNGNIVSEIGDVITITPNVPIVGLSAISGFVDVILGETGTRYFDKEFRYSLDGGLNYGEWIALTTPNLANVPNNPKFDFKVEYRYTRSGTDGSGVLVLEQIDIAGTYNLPSSGIAFDNSVFSEFFSTPHDLELLNWGLNVLEKLYLPGTIPLSLTRNENNNTNEEDRDYIDFWRAITTFYGTLVAYAREFEKIDDNNELLTKFLRGRDMFICIDTLTEDLDYLKSNFYDEMRHRGTAMIAIKKGHILPSGEEKPVDGELLRLLCYKSLCDEFLFGISEFGTVSWVVNQWSPLWQGVGNQHQFTKLYEQSTYVQDIANYPLNIGSGIVSVVTDAVAGGDVIEIDGVTPGTTVQIGGTGVATAVNVSPNIPYEISFYTRRIGAGSVTFDVRAYTFTETDAIANPASMVTGLTTATSISVAEFPDDGEYHFVRTIIWPHDKVIDLTSAEITYASPQGPGTTQNLRFQPNACKMSPFVMMRNTTGSVSGTMRLYNLRLAPLSTEYSTGFIGLSNYVQMWAQNNNGMYNQTQLDQIISRKLLPYKATLQNNTL